MSPTTDEHRARIVKAAQMSVNSLNGPILSQLELLAEIGSLLCDILEELRTPGQAPAPEQNWSEETRS